LLAYKGQVVRLTITCNFPDDAKGRVRTALKLMGGDGIRIVEVSGEAAKVPVRKDNVPTSPVAMALAGLYGRASDAEWADAEIAEFRKVKARGVLTIEAVEAIARHYARERKKPDNYCRRDLLTLLRHFDGELDRARAARPVAGKALEWTPANVVNMPEPDEAEAQRVREAARAQAAAFREQQGRMA
jgi:hypothetical protein